MGEAAKTHGLDGSLVAPDWPPLTLDEVRDVLHSYRSVEEPITLLSESPRPFSAASLVQSGDRRLFIKRHSQRVRNAEGLHEEHRFMDHLRAHGVPVPRVLQAKSGETAVEASGWTYEVHEEAQGLDTYGTAQSWTPFRSEQHAFAAAEALARLHRAAQSYHAPPRPQRQLVAGFTICAQRDLRSAMENYVSTRPTLARYASETGLIDPAIDLIEPFHAELQAWLPFLVPLWTHNDLHASNVFWSSEGVDAQVASIIDFGLCDRTCAVHDLAHMIERNVVEWLKLPADVHTQGAPPVHLNHLQALLRGYESVRPFSREEAAALAPMAALCHVEFALSEADYFLSILHSEPKARMACEGYLLGHARWFAGEGKRLLAWIRSWAASRTRADMVVQA